MRNSPLKILDETTAVFNARAEFEVIERFAELKKEKSAMLISHRFSTETMANQILVLEKDEILQIGSHEDLLKTGDAT